MSENEFANGANGRFDGLPELFRVGGHPREYPHSVAEALVQLGTYFGTYTQYTEEPKTLDLAREMKALRDTKDLADHIASELGKRYDFMRLALLPERFEAEGLQNLKAEGLGRVSLRGDIYAGILPGKKEDAFTWLGDTGRGDLIQPTVNASTLKASLKKAIEAGEDIPEDIFRVSPYTTAVISSR
jgi:hypothetical protein